MAGERYLGLLIARIFSIMNPSVGYSNWIMALSTVLI